MYINISHLDTHFPIVWITKKKEKQHGEQIQGNIPNLSARLPSRTFSRTSTSSRIFSKTSDHMKTPTSKRFSQKNLVHCHGGESSISKTTQEDIENLNFQMDRQEYVECDRNHRNCRFERSFDMTHHLEELLNGYSDAMQQEALKKKTEEFLRNLQERKF